MRYGLQMVWPNTRLIATEVVKFISSGDWPTLKFIGDAVRLNYSATDLHATVAVSPGAQP